MKCSRCKNEYTCNRNNHFPECKDMRYKLCLCLDCHVICLEKGFTIFNYDNPKNLGNVDKEIIDDLKICFGEIVDAIVIASKL